MALDEAAAGRQAECVLLENYFSYVCIHQHRKSFSSLPPLQPSVLPGALLSAHPSFIPSVLKKNAIFFSGPRVKKNVI